VQDLAPAPKLSNLLDNGRMARGMHRLRSVVLSSLASAVVPMSLAACVVPPSVQPEDDNSEVPNNPPAIRKVTDSAGQELTRPGPLAFVVGAGMVNVFAADTDLDDTLYVRMYIDYGLADATPFRVQCESAPGNSPLVEREVNCPLLGLCTDGLIDGQTHIFELDVLDREPISTAARPFRGVTVPGEISTFWWQLTCVAP